MGAANGVEGRPIVGYTRCSVVSTSQPPSAPRRAAHGDAPPVSPRLRRLGNYELLVELASGGMATVYAARRVGAAGFERMVVVKRVHRHLVSDPEFRDMFLDESRVASQIHHPNVVPVIDVEELEGELFLVMEYVDGSTLAKMRGAAAKAKRKLPPPVVARIIGDTLAGLHAAHEAVDRRGDPLDIVHRDVSPQNIMIGADGIARLIDFGIAKAARRITATRTGGLKGKYGYMSPEQTVGERVDRRTDLFALGVVMHEALTGERLFHGDNELDTLRRIVEQPIVPPSARSPEVPKALDGVVEIALRRLPEERFASAAEFLEALEAAIRPASHRDVRDCLEASCGTAIRERRQTLRAHATGDLEAAHGLPEALHSDRPTARYVSIPPPPALPHIVPEATRPRAAPASSEPGPPARAAGPSWWVVASGAALIAMLASGVATYAVTHRSAKIAAAPAGPPEAAASAHGDAAGEPLPSASSVAAPDDAWITVTVTADRNIREVRAQGLHDATIDGKRATFRVAPWAGPLAIDATLDGNRRARGAADANGARDVTLKTDAPPPPAAPVHAAHPQPTGTLDIHTSR